jgi:glutamine synthetase
MQATFMAKPYEEYAGSGMHVHISMLDRHGNNLFVPMMTAKTLHCCNRLWRE